MPLTALMRYVGSLEERGCRSAIPHAEEQTPDLGPRLWFPKTILSPWQRLEVYRQLQCRAMLPPGMAVRAPTSQVLDGLLRAAPAERVSLGWLVDRLGERSFGIILLLIAFLALMPGISPVAGVLLAVPAFQMIRAHSGPIFPPRIAGRRFETRRLAAIIRRAIPVLRYLERFIYPRWRTPFESTKRVVGGAVLLLSATLFVPAPLSNIPSAIVIALIAFGYLEQDGALLTLALIAAFGLLAIVAATIWELLSTTGWVEGFL